MTQPDNFAGVCDNDVGVDHSRVVLRIRAENIPKGNVLSLRTLYDDIARIPRLLT
jgi:hypothetical protein